MGSWLLIFAGLLLSLLGWFVPLMMVSHVLPPTVFLNFGSFTASMAGLMLGIVGASQYAGRHRPRRLY